MLSRRCAIISEPTGSSSLYRKGVDPGHAVHGIAQRSGQSRRVCVYRGAQRLKLSAGRCLYAEEKSPADFGLEARCGACRRRLRQSLRQGLSAFPDRV